MPSRAFIFLLFFSLFLSFIPLNAVSGVALLPLLSGSSVDDGTTVVTCFSWLPKRKDSTRNRSPPSSIFRHDARIRPPRVIHRDASVFSGAYSSSSSSSQTGRPWRRETRVQLPYGLLAYVVIVEYYADGSHWRLFRPTKPTGRLDEMRRQKTGQNQKGNIQFHHVSVRCYTPLRWSLMCFSGRRKTPSTTFVPNSNFLTGQPVSGALNNLITSHPSLTKL